LDSIPLITDGISRQVDGKETVIVCSKSFWRCPDTKFGENLTWWKLPNEVIRSPFFIIEDPDGFHPLLGIAFKDPMTPEEVMAAYNGLRGSFVKI